MVHGCFILTLLTILDDVVLAIDTFASFLIHGIVSLTSNTSTVVSAISGDTMVRWYDTSFISILRNILSFTSLDEAKIIDLFTFRMKGLCTVRTFNVSIHEEEWRIT